MIYSRPILEVFTIVLVAGLSMGCDDSKTGKLKGQSNVTFQFCGLAVDQNGLPLSGAKFQIDVESIPSDWTYENRGKGHDHNNVSAVSDSNGRIQLNITGHILRFTNVSCEGYAHFTEMDTSSDSTATNTFYYLSGWGDLSYKTDQDHPAIYVFVRDGANFISVLPSMGGFRASCTCS